jgi:hypothetical protein
MPSLAWLVVPFALSRYYSVSDHIGAAYPLSICFAVGVWLVIWRFQTVRDRAVPFKLRAPPVSPIHYWMYACILIITLTGRRPRLGVRCYPRTSPRVAPRG